MASYIDDRIFTNYIHNHVALSKIYKPLGWEQVTLNQQYAENIDLQDGIDYIFIDKNGQYKTVQERFREFKYKEYSDFTIRYRRDKNSHVSRIKSEYYKIKAAYFTYGIAKCSKQNYNTCTDFIKYAVIDLKKVYEKLDKGLIIIQDNNKNRCEIIDNKIICPIKYNHGNL
jgi:hypothetical protein